MGSFAVHKKMLALVVGALPIGWLAVGQAVHAQETTVFEPVIVTAQKREQSIYDVPVAISAFTADTIEKQGISDLTDIGKFVPNLNVTGFSAGQTSSTNPFIRGIGLQDHLITTDPGVGVYVDGVYLGRQVGQNWSLANIERVEVLRGPQGTLYGRNSIGGAINIITRKPGDEDGGRVSLTAGDRGRLNADFYTNMAFSDQFAMSVTGAFQHRDGLGEFVNIENPRKEVGEMEDISARVAFKWSPTDRLSFLVSADGNEGDGGLRPYDTLIDELGAECRATAADPTTCECRPNGGVYDAGYRNSDTAIKPLQQQYRPGVADRGDQLGRGAYRSPSTTRSRQHGGEAPPERPAFRVQGGTRRRRLLRRFPELPGARPSRPAVGGTAAHGRLWGV